MPLAVPNVTDLTDKNITSLSSIIGPQPPDSLFRSAATNQMMQGSVCVPLTVQNLSKVRKNLQRYAQGFKILKHYAK